jgi:hypothetical protein
MRVTCCCGTKEIRLRPSPGTRARVFRLKDASHVFSEHFLITCEGGVVNGFLRVPATESGCGKDASARVRGHLFKGPLSSPLIGAERTSSKRSLNPLESMEKKFGLVVICVDALTLGGHVCTLVPGLDRFADEELFWTRKSRGQVCKCWRSSAIHRALWRL